MDKARSRPEGPPSVLPSLPDLPDLEIGADAPVAPGAISPARGRRRRTLRQWLGQGLSLLVMALLAAGSWWLLRLAPSGGGAGQAPPPRVDPDYTMTGFSITRFDAGGQARVRIDGARLRHFPQTDRLEIEGVRIHATSPDGRRTEATANRALANGDASEVQLIGGARVISQLGDGQVLDVRSEFLHAFLRFEQLKSHLPVIVQRGAAQAQAGGLFYDHLQQQLQFLGPVRLSWPQRDRVNPVGSPTPQETKP